MREAEALKFFHDRLTQKARAGLLTKTADRASGHLLFRPHFVVERLRSSSIRREFLFQFVSYLFNVEVNYELQMTRLPLNLNVCWW